MQLTKVIGNLSRNDTKLIGRDSFLLSLLAYVFISAVVLRLAIPPLAERLLVENDFDLTEYYPLLVAFFVISTMGAVAMGTMVGFLLLDERDDNTIKAMLVTPMPLSYFVGYRVGISYVLGFVIILLGTYIVNLTIIPLWQMILVAAAGALFAPIVALFLGTFAANKVQGFAQLKIVGTAGIVIAIAWFVQEPLQFLFGLFPPYWVAKAFWTMDAGGNLWPLFLVIGALMQIGVLVYLVRRFNVVAHR